jgi:hypothetical protein
MGEDEYRQAEGLSNSWLKIFDRSPNHAKYYKYESKHMQLGSTRHNFLFDEKLFMEENIIAPEKFDGLPLLNKKNVPYPKFAKLHEGRNVILQNELKDLQGIKENLLKTIIYGNLTFDYLFNNSQKEISFFWEKEIEGQIIQKKGRADLLYQTENFNIIVDYKSMTNCLDFYWQNNRMKYYRQDAWYSEGIYTITGLPTIFIFLTFEIACPYGVLTRYLDGYWKQKGKEENDMSVLNYIKWANEGKPDCGYPEGAHIITQFRGDCL